MLLFLESSESQNSRSAKIETRELILNPHYAKFETRIYSTWFHNALSVNNVSAYCKNMGYIIVIIVKKNSIVQFLIYVKFKLDIENHDAEVNLGPKIMFSQKCGIVS